MKTRMMLIIFLLAGLLADRAWALCEVQASPQTYPDGAVLNGNVCDTTGALKISGDIGTVSISSADGAITDGASAAIKATVKDYTNSNPLTTIIVDTNGDPASIGGGTEYTEDAAAAANPVGKMGICRRKDTLSAAEVSADGDNIACNATAKGEMYVKQTDPVPATQSGTWTMQPGNTANTTPWVFSIQQGGNTAAVNASSQLSVNCANCSGSGVSQQDNTGFTPGTTNFVPMGGEVDDTGTTAVTENNAGVARITAQRAVHMNLRNNSGTEIGTSGTPLVVGDGSGAMNVIVDSSALPTGAAADATLTGGTQKAIVRGGAKGGTSAADVTGTASGANHQALDVVIYDTSGNAITSFGGSGGTSSNFGSAFPTPGTAAGFTDGTNMVAGRVVTSAPGTSDAGLVVRPISPASSTIGSAVPTVGVQVTGSDGTNARALATDTSGNVQSNVKQINGVAPSMGNGASGTGTQRVTIANDSTGTVTVTQGTGTNLHVVCDSGCSSSAGFADNGAFTFGTTAINPIGGVFDDTSSNTATENSAAIARITQNKAIHTNLRNASGTEIGTSGNPIRTDPTGTTTQPVNVAQMNGTTITMGNGVAGTGVQRVTLASDSTGTVAATQATAANLNVRPDTSGATGAAPPARANFTGGLGSGATGGFLTGFAVCDSFVNVNVSTPTTTALITGVSGRHVRICGINLVTLAANNVALISGTGATCGTGTTGMNGGTTAASGWNFAANGGLTQGNGLGAVNQTNATGDSVCIVTSAATQLSGRIAYTIY